jgi:hypothetical protein
MKMTKYRKKPVVIEAIQFDGTGDSFDEIDKFTNGKMYVHDNIVYIKTLEGDMIASIGDYIIKGVNGEFYPCKPDIFKKTYEPYNSEPIKDQGEQMYTIIVLDYDAWMIFVYKDGKKIKYWSDAEDSWDTSWEMIELMNPKEIIRIFKDTYDDVCDLENTLDNKDWFNLSKNDIDKLRTLSNANR